MAARVYLQWLKTSDGPGRGGRPGGHGNVATFLMVTRDRHLLLGAHGWTSGVGTQGILALS